MYRILSRTEIGQKLWRIMLEALWPHPPSLGLLRLKQCFPGSLSALLIFRVFTGGSLAIVVVRYRGIGGFVVLRGWMVAGRFALHCLLSMTV